MSFDLQSDNICEEVATLIVVIDNFGTIYWIDPESMHLAFDTVSGYKDAQI